MGIVVFMVFNEPLPRDKICFEDKVPVPRVFPLWGLKITLFSVDKPEKKYFKIQTSICKPSCNIIFIKKA